MADLNVRAGAGRFPRSQVQPPPSAQQFFVDHTAGNDANAGTSSGAAWKTIAKVNASSFLPGNQILFKRGEVWWETLAAPSSGSAGSVITFGAYGSGATPVINAGTSFRYNHTDSAQYDASGLGHRNDKGFSRNGDMETATSGVLVIHGVNVFSGTGTALQDVTQQHSGLASCKLFAGDSGVRINVGGDVYLQANQRYEISFYAKSDGVGTATVRFLETTNGLANTDSGGGVYQTWTGTANITALAVGTGDTTWTEKKITVQVNSSSHSGVEFQIWNQVTGQSVWIDTVRIRPLWVNVTGDVWSAGWDESQIGTAHMIAFGGVPTIQAANVASVNSTNRWFVEVLGGQHNLILYVNSPSGNPATSGESIDIATTTNSLTLDGNLQDYVTYQELEFRHAYHVAGDFGDHNTVADCTLTNGIEIVRIENNANFTLQDSTLSYGDWMVDLDNCTSPTIRRCTLFGAKIYGPLVSNEGGALAPSAVGGDVVDLIVEDCHIYDCQRYGIAEWGAIGGVTRVLNAIYRRNRVHDVLYGFWSQAEAGGGIVNSRVLYNLFYDPKPGSVGSGHDVDQASNGLRLYRADNSVLCYGNVIVGFDYTVEFWNGTNAVTFKNNISLNPNTAHIFDSNADAIVTLNHNCYYPDGAAMFQWNGDFTLTFTQWQTASSQDASAVLADPLFTNAGTFDLTLQGGSPARNVGETLGTDYDDGLHPSSVWPSSVVTVVQSVPWNIGAYSD